MANKKSKLIFLSPEIIDKLELASQQEHRSVSNMIEHIILDFFEKKEGIYKII